uniref:Uncharacterized protein n=2 Tax=Timema TaxID=61471 RepID=A0A7R9G1Q8_TIMSH|nr:unnamed protein product [Timema shepardi]CAD7570499.1 unnamed protein product [Timema californicum]
MQRSETSNSCLRPPHQLMPPQVGNTDRSLANHRIPARLMTLLYITVVCGPPFDPTDIIVFQKRLVPERIFGMVSGDKRPAEAEVNPKRQKGNSGFSTEEEQQEQEQQQEASDKEQELNRQQQQSQREREEQEGRIRDFQPRGGSGRDRPSFNHYSSKPQMYNANLPFHMHGMNVYPPPPPPPPPGGSGNQQPQQGPPQGLLQPPPPPPPSMHQQQYPYYNPPGQYQQYPYWMLPQ